MNVTDFCREGSSQSYIRVSKSMLAPLLTATKVPPCRKWMIMEMIFNDFAGSKEFAPPPGRRSRRSASARPWPRRPRAPGPHLISTKKERMPFEKRNLKEFMENDGKRIIFQNMTSEDLGVEKRLYPSIVFLKNKQVVQVSNSNFD